MIPYTYETGRCARLIHHDIRWAGRRLVLFAVTLTAAWLLLFLSTLIPNQVLREQFLLSAQSYSQRDAFQFTLPGRLDSVADHYADTIWLNVAWNMGETGSVLAGYYDGEELGENAGLYLTVEEGTPPNTDYTRYWHGTAGIIRILSLFTHVEGIKMAGLWAILVLAALCALLLVRLGHPGLGGLLAVSLLAVRFWRLGLSMEYQPAFLLTFLLIPPFLLLERKGDRYLVDLSVISGVLVAFYDFLTTETVTILLPLALVYAVRGTEGRVGTLKKECAVVARSVLAWGLAYGGSFLVKWTAACLLGGYNAFSAALSSVGERVSGGLADFAEPPANLFSALLANLTMMFGSGERVDFGRVLVGLGIFGLILLSVWYLLRENRGRGVSAAVLLCLGGLVPVRYLVLNNHSYLHCFFTYRALVTPVFVLLAVVWMNIRLPESKRRGR